MNYPTQIIVNDKLIVFKRDWTTEQRQRFERIVCSLYANPDFSDWAPKDIYKHAFAQMVMIDNFYTQTQITDNE